MTETAVDGVFYPWTTNNTAVDGAVPGGLLAKLLVKPVLRRKGTMISSKGIEIRKLVGDSRTLPWSDIACVEVHNSFNHGDHLVLTLKEGSLVKLPAPTGKTIGSVSEAKARIEIHLGG